MADSPSTIERRKLTVKVSPPNAILSLSSLDPTESGPTKVRSCLVRMIEPPPKAILWTSGMVKFVLTPAILANAAACLG